MALILGRVCSRSALQGLLSSSVLNGSALLSLPDAGARRGAATGSDQSRHDPGNSSELDSSWQRTLSGRTASSSHGGGGARMGSSFAALGTPAGAHAYATASTPAVAAPAATPVEEPEATTVATPSPRRAAVGMPIPAPGPKGARIASRKPALKKPSRHQWFYCDVNYDPFEQPPANPLPPYAPEWARQKDYRAIYYAQRPKHHRNKYHRGWQKNMRLADQRWKEAWQANLANQARWDATVERKKNDLKRGVAWRAWQTWTAGAAKAGGPAAPGTAGAPTAAAGQ